MEEEIPELEEYMPDVLSMYEEYAKEKDMIPRSATIQKIKTKGIPENTFVITDQEDRTAKGLECFPNEDPVIHLWR